MFKPEKEIFDLKTENAKIKRENKFLQSRITKSSPSWRKVRPTLSYEEIIDLATMDLEDIQEMFEEYDMTERTAWNWREYAKSEINKSE